MSKIVTLGIAIYFSCDKRTLENNLQTTNLKLQTVKWNTELTND